MKKKPPEYLSQLVRELRIIWNDREFIEGTVNDLLNEEDCNTMLEFIRSGKNVTVETVCVFAVLLRRKRDELNKQNSKTGPDGQVNN